MSYNIESERLQDEATNSLSKIFIIYDYLPSETNKK